MAGPSTIDDYLSSVPEEVRVALNDLRKTIAAAAPEATETISYQMPTFKYRGQRLAYFAAFKDHCSFFPASAEVLDSYAQELGPFRTSKGTLRFSPDSPIPRDLVMKIVKARMKEIDAGRP
jgi:uncharacterized protein YdhG (YjbR/CyaY superfamily)